MAILKFLLKTSLLSILCLLFTILSCKSPGKYEEINTPDNLNDEADINANKLQNEEIAPQKESIANEIKTEIDPKIETKIDPKIDPKIETKIAPKIEPKVKVIKTRAEIIEEKAQSLTEELFEIYGKFSVEEQNKYDELSRKDVKGSMKFLLGRGIFGLNVRAHDLITTLGKYYSSPCGGWFNAIACHVTGKKLAYIYAYQKASFDEKAKFKI